MNGTEQPKQKESRINLRELDPDLHAQFKARCAQRGRSMKGLVVAFMRDVVSADDKKRVVNVGKLSREYSDPR